MFGTSEAPFGKLQAYYVFVARKVLTVFRSSGRGPTLTRTHLLGRDISKPIIYRNESNQTAESMAGNEHRRAEVANVTWTAKA